MKLAALELVPSAERRRWLRYLFAVASYGVSEGLAFGLFAPLLRALLQARTGEAAWWLVPLVGVAAVGWFARHAVGLRSLRLSSAWRRDLYDRLGEQLMRVPIGWFDGPEAGRLPQVMTADVARVTQLVFLADSLVGAVLTPLTAVVFLLSYDWRMGLAAMVAVPLVLTALTLGRRLTESTESAEHQTSAEAGRLLVEFAGAQPTLRASGQVEAGWRDLDAALDAQYASARRGVSGSLPGQYLGQLGIQLAFTALVASGAVLVTGQHLTAASTIPLVVLGIATLLPLEVVVGASTALSAWQASQRRVRSVLKTPRLPEPDRTRISMPRLADHRVEFDAVSFGYPGRGPLLRGVSVEIPTGSTTALVGVSGAGKTTLTKLIARFHDVDSGAVRIGGVDVRDLTAQEVLERVAVVFQDVFLLDTTIEENIRVGNPSATDEQVRRAAERARVDSIVARLPDGWKSRVGEGGRLLSGGERQRIAIARALCKDAPIVLLDEATASLDTENGAAVQAAIAELALDRTVLIIAHRLETVAAADRIAVLHDGRIVESGTHRHLLAAGGRYADFWAQRRRAAGWRLSGSQDS